MKRIGWSILALFLGLSSILHFQTVLIQLEPLHLLHSHRVLSVTSLFTSEFSESDPGYLRIEGGYVIPSYSLSNDDIKIWNAAYLVSDSGKAFWLNNRKEGQLTGLPEDRLLISFDQDQFSQIWSELGDDLSTIHPFSLPPVQMAVVGKIETFTRSIPKARDSDYFNEHYLRLENTFAPWSLLFYVGLVWGTLNCAYRCFPFRRTEAEVEAYDTSIGTSVRAI